MSAVEGDRTGRCHGPQTPVPLKAPAVDCADVPSISAGQSAELYAAGERERRNTSVERAIARARAAS